MKSETLKLTFPSGLTFLTALILLIALLAAGEWLARSRPVQENLPAPSLGVVHRNLEVQIDVLEQRVAHNEAIDCLMLGDSTVMTDFVPASFESAFHEQTGKEIDCLNLGVGASTVASSVALAEVMMKEYRPALLILGLEALNFTVSTEDQESGALLEAPWIRYKLGRPSIEGWLYDHSRLLEYRPILRKLLRFEFDFLGVLQGSFPDESGIINGYFPLNGQGPFAIDEPPNPDSEHPFDEHYFAELGNFRLLPENVQALEELARSSDDTTQVFVVEMPVAESFVYYYRNGEQDHEAFINTIEDLLSAHDMSFWPTSELHLFTIGDWYNRNHLNTAGAQVFSEWLGRQVGQAVLNKSSLGETWTPIP
jgi:hypothetical protein